MSSPKPMPIILFILLFIFQLTSGTVEQNKIEDSLPLPMPVATGRIEYRVAAEFDRGGQRRKLAPFQVCLACKCCVTASDPSTCSDMPCCFGIDCQLPNKPFGVCAFVPKTCNCTTCATS